MKKDRSGFGKEKTKYTENGPGTPGGTSWTIDWLKFDNSYFKVTKPKHTIQGLDFCWRRNGQAKLAFAVHTCQCKVSRLEEHNKLHQGQKRIPPSDSAGLSQNYAQLPSAISYKHSQCFISQKAMHLPQEAIAN